MPRSGRPDAGTQQSPTSRASPLRDEASLSLTEPVNTRSADEPRINKFVEHSGNHTDRHWARFLDQEAFFSRNIPGREPEII
jgi:hypothetical protein